MLDTTAGPILGGIAIAFVLKLTTSVDDLLWFSPFLALCETVREKAKCCTVYACVCLIVTFVAVLLAHLANSGFDAVLSALGKGGDGGDLGYWDASRVLSIVASAFMGLYGYKEFREWREEDEGNRLPSPKDVCNALLVGWTKILTCVSPHFSNSLRQTSFSQHTDPSSGSTHDLEGGSFDDEIEFYRDLELTEEPPQPAFANMTEGELPEADRAGGGSPIEVETTKAAKKKFQQNKRMNKKNGSVDLEFGSSGHGEALMPLSPRGSNEDDGIASSVSCSAAAQIVPPDASEDEGDRGAVDSSSYLSEHKFPSNQNSFHDSRASSIHAQVPENFAENSLSPKSLPAEIQPQHCEPETEEDEEIQEAIERASGSATRLFVVAFCGTLDDMAMFAAVILGKSIHWVSLVVGSILATSVILVACWQISLYKPFAEAIRKVPMWVLLGVLSVYILVSGLLR